MKEERLIKEYLEKQLHIKSMMEDEEEEDELGGLQLKEEFEEHSLEQFNEVFISAKKDKNVSKIQRNDGKVQNTTLNLSSKTHNIEKSQSLNLKKMI